MARPGRRNSAVSVAVAAVIALAGWWFTQHDDSPSGSTDRSYSSSTFQVVQLSSLPPEAAQTVRLIDAGGPFPYPDHDGGTFGNYEGLLPEESSGYYREYTVPTPGESDRGARRIIAAADGTLYWTADHYEHFAVIGR